MLLYGTLFNQYLVDIYAKIETEKLNFRPDNYIHFKDSIERQNVQVDQLGKVEVLPFPFTRGSRYMHEQVQVGWCRYVQHNGSSDLFITFTCT